jgi:hypothetical protein
MRKWVSIILPVMMVAFSSSGAREDLKRQGRSAQIAAPFSRFRRHGKGILDLTNIS